jgi:hypothetical protein
MDDKALERGLWIMRVFWLVIFASEVSMLVGIFFGFPHMRDKMRPYVPEISVVAGIGILAWAIVGPPRALLRELREELVIETTDDGKSVKDPRRTTLQALRDFSQAIVRTWVSPVAVSMIGFFLSGYGMPRYFVMPFLIIPVALALTQFPRLGALAKLIERAKGVRCEP